jgi:hypothetical protein
MQSQVKIIARVLIVAALLFSILFWLAACFRWSALIFAAACIITLPFLSSPRRQVSLNILVFGFLALSLLSADISFRTRPGSPKFIRVVYGLPAGDLLEIEKRGEVILGGCVVNGYVPSWVLVW